ncbi:acryloyl-CoA reductase [Paenibacillus caui]|uniref:acrylyl-CoA reductase family protein n=1 Tax=Paenibacillus caui TaxID=2873927 RepID=UPI001CA8955F|nr:acryloyl-CoA reductase [Paenibacillus caui]
MISDFQAFRLHQDEQGFRANVETVSPDVLPAGGVLLRVLYSGVNYKDGLASLPDGKIVNQYPFTPGIDLAGIVAESADERFKPGDRVLCTGYGLGVSHPGGYAEYASVPGDWLVPLPAGLTPLEAMAIGTAGFTAALSVERLLAGGLTPESGPVLVAGATGGVGSMAVAILARLGFKVTAGTGKPGEAELLRRLGAAEIASREELAAGAGKGALGQQLWAGVVDPVGGSFTAGLLKNVKYGGSAALSGMTGGGKLETSVFPFILRGVNLFGIDSVYCPMPLRRQLWEKLAGAWKPEAALSEAITIHPLAELPEALKIVLAGKAVGRQVIKLAQDFE